MFATIFCDRNELFSLIKSPDESHEVVVWPPAVWHMTYLMQSLWCHPEVITRLSDCFLCGTPQETTVGINPVQIETGEFDEAIQIEEDFPAESKYTWPHTYTQMHKLKHTIPHVCIHFSQLHWRQPWIFWRWAWLVYSCVSLTFTLRPTVVNFNIRTLHDGTPPSMLFDLRRLSSALQEDRRNDWLSQGRAVIVSSSQAAVMYLSSRPQVCGRWLPLRCQHLWLPVIPGVNKMADVLI